MIDFDRCGRAVCGLAPWCGIDTGDRKFDARRFEADSAIAHDPRQGRSVALAGAVNDKGLVRIDDEIVRHAGEPEIARELRIDVRVDGESTSTTIRGLGTSSDDGARRGPQ